MLFHKASLKLAMYWGMLAEEGIPEVEKSAFEINFLLKNIQWASRKILGIICRKLNIEQSLSTCHQPFYMGQDHWTSDILQK